MTGLKAVWGHRAWEPTHVHVRGGLRRELHRGLTDEDLRKVVVFESCAGSVWVMDEDAFDAEHVPIADLRAAEIGRSFAGLPPRPLPDEQEADEGYALERPDAVPTPAPPPPEPWYLKAADWTLARWREWKGFGHRLRWDGPRWFGYEGDRWVAYFWFVGWDSVALGVSVCWSLPDVEVHLPFGFVRVGRRPENER